MAPRQPIKVLIMKITAFMQVIVAVVVVMITTSSLLAFAAGEQPEAKDRPFVVAAKTYTTQDWKSSRQWRIVVITIESNRPPAVEKNGLNYGLDVRDEDGNVYHKPTFQYYPHRTDNGQYELTWFMLYKPVPPKHIGKLKASVTIKDGEKVLPISVFLAHHPWQQPTP